jgi:acetyltransferase-like isoleucine patch superfamily enzyme
MTFKGLVQRLKRAMVAFAADSVAAAPKPFVSNPDRVFGLTPDLSIDPTARLIVPGGPEGPARIVLGRGIALGRLVEIATAEDGLLAIGDDTSIQDYSVIIGDVRIGAHCLFSLSVHVTSSTHHFRHRAPWLIRDQDRTILSSHLRIGTRSWPVIIEDDCWIGWGVVILPGVYVGRGAVIGANSVVSRDVPPYEVHAGAPNVRVGKRLDFAPAERINAGDDGCLPYFYRGFELTQQALARSRTMGVIEAREEACLVLAGTSRGVLTVGGRILDPEASAASLAVRINGVDCGTRRVEGREFLFEIPIPDAASRVTQSDGEDVPAILRDFTYVEIRRSGASGHYGIGAVSLAQNERPAVRPATQAAPATS